MDKYLATEDKHHVLRRSPFAENKVAIVTKLLRADREPGKLLFGKTLQIINGAQGRDDFSDAFLINTVFYSRLICSAIWNATRRMQVRAAQIPLGELSA